MNKYKILLISIAVTVAAFASSSRASQAYMNGLQNHYPGQADKGIACFQCLLCHTSLIGGTSNLNIYGQVWLKQWFTDGGNPGANNGNTLDPQAYQALDEIKNLDSDGDGVSNICEITGNAYAGCTGPAVASIPGDASSTPNSPGTCVGGGNNGTGTIGGNNAFSGLGSNNPYALKSSCGLVNGAEFKTDVEPAQIMVYMLLMFLPLFTLAYFRTMALQLIKK